MNNLRTEHYKSAKQHLEANGVNFNKSGYFELSSLERDLILSVAKQCGYKKNYNPNCCLARQSQRIDGFFWLLKRL